MGSLHKEDMILHQSKKESQFFCESNGFDAAGDIQFAVDVLGVGFYRIQGNKKSFGKSADRIRNPRGQYKIAHTLIQLFNYVKRPGNVHPIN